MSHAVFVDIRGYSTFLNSYGLHRRGELIWKNNLGKRTKKGGKGNDEYVFLEWNRDYGGVKLIKLIKLYPYCNRK